LEILLLSVVYYQVWDIYRIMLVRDLFHFRGKFLLIGVYIIIAALTFHACESTRFDKLKFFDLSVSQCISCLLINGITWLQVCLIVNGVITPLPMVILTVVDFVICILFSYILTSYFRQNGKARDGLLISGSEEGYELKDKIIAKEGQESISEAVSSELSIKELENCIDRHSYVIINDVPAEKRNDLLKYCFSSGKSTYVVPKITDVIMKGAEQTGLYDTPLLQIRQEGIGPVEAFFKRAMDLLLVLAALIPGSVLMLGIAIAIRLEDHGPVFYTQKRLTKDNRVFDILKFRSMIVDAEKNTGAVLAGENDSRITKVGKFLRACRLDELPQLLNILKGDMSIVGPRPERVELTAKIMEEMPEFAYRTKVKAGLTGYAQVYGKYNTTSYDKLRLDLMYIEQYSLLLDLKLILMTPQILLRREAAEGVREKKN